ncbi:MAG: hypothetical protein DRJ43_01700 [Thermoprotei archaeon]|nr:MAG: hypothetical protein DRJ43_01700 [Thermoprotei archaeon]
MMEVGRVVAVYGRNVLRFAVPEERMRLVLRPGTYVKVRAEGLWLYAMVVSFNLLDELYRSSRIVEELEGYLEFRPSRNELVATLVGYSDSKSLGRGVPVLPRPGQKVYLVPSEELAAVMGRGDVELGTLSYDERVKFSLHLNMLCSRHFAILAMTGAGKSNTVAVILASILTHYPYARIVLIDTHSEYVPLKERFSETVHVLSPAGRISRLVEARYGVEPERLEIPLWTLSFEEVANLLRLGPQATKQLMYLRTALQEVRRRRFPSAATDDPVYYTPEELRSAVKAIPARDRSLEDLQLKLESLMENVDLRYITKPEYSDEVYLRAEGEEPWRSVKTYLEVYGRILRAGLNVIALGGLPSEAQASTTATLLKAIWRLIGAGVLAGEAMPTLVVVEEAHLYAPQGRWSPAREVLEKIAKEGRKFGIGLGVVSQRPRELSQTLLAQCGTLIALRTVNPEDQRHILSSMEDVAREMIEGLSGLRIGEALISGPAAPLPAIVNVYHFPHKFGIDLGGKDINWVEEWSRKPRILDLAPFIIGELEEEERRERLSLEEFL